MFPDWIHNSLEIVFGGPDVPLGERLLRAGLVGCSLFVGIQWASMWGTRWGDRHRVAKSFILSLLVHLCLCLGWATVVVSYPGTTESNTATPSSPIPVTFRDESRSRGAENVDDGMPVWQRPTDPPTSPQTRADQHFEPESTELPRMDRPQSLLEPDGEQPSIATSADIPADPQQMEISEVRPAPAPVEAAPSQDETPVLSREEARPKARSQRRDIPNSDVSPTADEKELPRSMPAREKASTILNGTPAITPGVSAGASQSELRQPPLPPEQLPQPRRAKIPVVRAAPAPVSEPEHLVSMTGVLRGVVKDAESGQILAGTTIRFDRAQGKPIMAVTDAEGRYELSLPETPDNFAITAAHADYLPEARNLKSIEVRGKTRRLDFALRQPAENVIPLEDQPEVHHLGNNRFEGTANSQFQQRSEGMERVFHFSVTAEQLRRRFPHADVTFLAKGVQCAPRVSINGQLVDTTGKVSPVDGAYGGLELPFDARWLKLGDNTLTIRATDCSGDLDDFEFVNVQIRLMKTLAKPVKE